MAFSRGSRLGYDCPAAWGRPPAGSGLGGAIMSKSESRRYRTPVRLAKDLVDDAWVVARLKGVDLAAYFTGVLRPVVDRDLAAALRERLAALTPAPSVDP